MCPVILLIALLHPASSSEGSFIVRNLIHRMSNRYHSLSIMLELSRDSCRRLLLGKYYWSRLFEFILINLNSCKIFCPDRFNLCLIKFIGLFYYECYALVKSKYFCHFRINVCKPISCFNAKNLLKGV